jgi:hypothetical protein
VQAATAADTLITRVMEARGYPMKDFDAQADLVSVDHPGTVENYRFAHAVRQRSQTQQVGTEDLREALLRYRSLFDELLRPEGNGARGATDGQAPAGADSRRRVTAGPEPLNQGTSGTGLTDGSAAMGSEGTDLADPDPDYPRSADRRLPRSADRQARRTMNDTDNTQDRGLTTEQIAAAGPWTGQEDIPAAGHEGLQEDVSRPAGHEGFDDGYADHAGPGPRASLLEDGELQSITARWKDIQAEFVDEPGKAVHEADALVAELMQRLAAMFAAECAGLEKRWAGGHRVSTEDLRQGLRRYRSFFERLLAA